MPTTMDYQKTMRALKRLRVETGSLACFGCGHEHNCSTQGCAILRNAVGHMEAALERATLTPPNEWVSVEDAFAPEHEPVLCIVSGKPNPNITLEDAYQIGSWNKADGWIIDEYLDWEDADVSWWMLLPAPPAKEDQK